MSYFMNDVLELKRAKRYTEMEKLCQEALQQIEKQHYDAELIEEEYPLILKYGICFCKKSCMVKIEKNKNVWYVLGKSWHSLFFLFFFLAYATSQTGYGKYGKAEVSIVK